MSPKALKAAKARKSKKASPKSVAAANPPAEPLKLDLGCGTQKQPGFVGVDQTDFVGVDVKFDLRQTPWPWADDSVGEVHCSHFLEHLGGIQRVTFMNELYRVLQVGGVARFIVPHYASSRAYGDFTHQWPPIGEFYWFYLNATWRKTQAPHTCASFVPFGYACNFSAGWGNAMHPKWLTRNQEMQQFAAENYREAIQDLHIQITKAPMDQQV